MSTAKFLTELTKKQKLLPFILFSLVSIYGNTQTIIEGLVTDQKGAPIIGASVAIEDSYDGGITNEAGIFSFETFEEGAITLIISYLGYESKAIRQDIATLSQLDIKLRESVMTLDAVEVSASTFKAGDNSKVAVLKPLDIVTTAGSMGDVIAALQTLPGSQSNAEDGRLFVRGGEARETNIYVDGLRVFSPYIRTVGGSPTRGRFSPMLFKGISFSTGGYSAAYGQSLSGVLDMNTIDDPNDRETNVQIMTVGLGLGHTQKWEKQSISINSSYVNLTPYTWAVPSRANWIDPYAGFSGEAVYRYKIGSGLLKSYVASDFNDFKLVTNNLDSAEDEIIAIRNNNLYSNTTYNGILTEKTSIYTGISVGFNTDDLQIDESFNLRQKLNGFHGRLALKTILNDRFITNYGFDYLSQNDKIETNLIDATSRDDISNPLVGAFLESDYFFSKNLAIKTGIRAEYNTLLDKTFVDPRLTLAQKLSKNSQLSFAFGKFTQEVDREFLYYNDQLIPERSTHYLLNYNLKTDKQILRIESYYKDYDNLLRFQKNGEQLSNFRNDGDGYAYGLDLFWRANQLFKNIDFWLSYSWIEHRRKYRDFPTEATPNFSTTHNLSLVSKIWMPELRSQLGVTFRMASGRPYENPNTPGFLNERSKFFKNISMSWAYLITQQKILFVSVSNLPGFKNEFGYEFGNSLNAEGLFPGRVIRPNDDRFLFVGFFMTLSKDKTKNQLDNL